MGKVKEMLLEEETLESETKCEDCGNEQGNIVFCPFAEEIYDKQILTCICSDCYKERCDDI